jgi:hypothetical protein
MERRWPGDLDNGRLPAGIHSREVRTVTIGDGKILTIFEREVR